MLGVWRASLHQPPPQLSRLLLQATAMQTVIAQHQLLQPGLAPDAVTAEGPSLRLTTGIERGGGVILKAETRREGGTGELGGPWTMERRPIVGIAGS